MTDIELKSCPFCGWANPVWEVERLAYDWITYAVFCASCEARGKVADTKEEAAAAWNRRTMQAPIGTVAKGDIDDIESVVARYTFLIERGQDAALDRVNVWLNTVKPLEDIP